MKKLLMLSVILLLFGCQNSADQIANKETTTNKIPRNFIPLEATDFAEIVDLTGNIEAEKQIPISAKILGRIDEIRSEIGDKVRKGQIIARYSAVDNDSLIQYQSALSQLKSTEASAQNAVNTAQVQVQSQEKALDQIKKEESVQRQKQYDQLLTNAKLSEITISSALNFLDKTLVGTNKFRGMSNYENLIGSNNSILKNNLKLEIATLSREFENLEKTASSESEIINFAKIRLSLLEKTKKTMLDFENLVRGTVVTSSFSEMEKTNFLTQTSEYLKSLSSTITKLENFITGTNVLNEQLGLKILSAQNALEGSLSALELAKSNSKNQVIAAQSQVNIASNYQQEMIVKAPFDGVIISKNIDEGQLVSPGQIMFAIADFSGFKIRTEIADTLVGMIQIEMPVEIKVDGLSQNFAGKVTKINPALDPTTRKLGIEISIDNEKSDISDLKVGLFARMKMTLPARPAFFIPRNFVRFDLSGAKVMTKDEKLIPVEIKAEKDGLVEIQSPEISSEISLIQQ